jgi:large subunit ribosomal protein L1
MSVQGKRYRAAAEGLEQAKIYQLQDAMELAAKGSGAKFEESVEMAIRLGVDPRHADQNVRGTVALPHGTGRKVRVAVFAKGDKAKVAEAAGADFVGDDELIAKIRDEGWLEFDKAVATPDMMGAVGKIAKILGPRGLMPNPKVGTVTNDIEKAVSDLKAGQVEYRVEKTGIVHVGIGKASFGADKLTDNARTVIAALVKARPASAKGQYIKGISVSCTMGPGIKVDPADPRPAV